MIEQPILVKAILPKGAHARLSQAPDGTQVQVISRHPLTRSGVLAALRSLADTQADYSETHGNRAARDIWIEAGDRRLNLQTLTEILENEAYLAHRLDEFLRRFDEQDALHIDELM